MPKLPRIDGRTAIKAFESFGFVVDRINGSHHIMKKDGHRNVLTVPVHKSDDLATGTLRSLVRDSGITVEEFCDAVEKL